MLFRLRHKDGTRDPFSAGTYVDPLGRATHLAAKDFALVPGAVWTSPKTGGHYPIGWNIRVPSLGLDAVISTRLPDQELAGKTRSAPSYWKGATRVSATKKGQPVSRGRVSGDDRLRRAGPAGGVDVSSVTVRAGAGCKTNARESEPAECSRLESFYLVPAALRRLLAGISSSTRCLRLMAMMLLPLARQYRQFTGVTE